MRFCCEEKFASIVKGVSFDFLDKNGDGKVDRAEVAALVTHILKKKPEDFVVDNLLKAIDSNNDGFISEQEFNFLLAKVARRHRYINKGSDLERHNKF